MPADPDYEARCRAEAAEALLRHARHGHRITYHEAVIAAGSLLFEAELWTDRPDNPPAASGQTP